MPIILSIVSCFLWLPFVIFNLRWLMLLNRIPACLVLNAVLCIITAVGGSFYAAGNGGEGEKAQKTHPAVTAA